MEFRRLIADLYRGDEGAAATLYVEYGSLLRSVVRRHLHASARTRADSEDFVQEVWLAFVKDLPNERSFKTPAELAGFLAAIARNKVIDALRRCVVLQHANVACEQRIEADSELKDGLAGHGSTPSETAMRKEMQEHILESFLPAHRRIGGMILDGQELANIAETTGLSIRTIERIRSRILEKLQ